MKRFSDIFDEWAEEEDDKLMGLMTKLYGPLIQYTLLFPSWKRSNVKVTLGLMAFYIFAILLHFIILGFSIWRLKDHFNLASMAFHYFLIIGFLMTTVVLLNKDRQVLARIHRIVASDMGKYRTGRIYLEDKPQSYERGKKKELMRFLCLPGLIIVLAAGAVCVPYMKKLSQEESGDEAHYTSGGVNLNLPIALYYPFPTHTGLFHAVAVLGQLMAGAGVASLIGGMEVMLFRMTQAIIFEYRVLQYGVESLLDRARKLYSQMYPGKEIRTLPIADPALQACIGLCFNDLINHHHQIIQLVKGFETALKWPGAMAYSFGTGVIGLSLINMLDAKESGDYENLVLFMLLTLGEVLNMYMISTFGEGITTESKILRDVLYDIEWHKFNVKNRKTMLNFQVGITNPVILRAGGIVALCMDTFSSIMNTSYSFFNLVNANYG